MRVAIIGCGYVADLYLITIQRHPELELIGVMDQNQSRAERFAAFHSVQAYRSLQELLADSRVEMVINLTNPRSHFAVSAACLLHGKHVYSEKPLAMTLPEAEQLVKLAEKCSLYLSAAPSRLLGETAQTMWQKLRSGAIGTPRLAYAEMDDGLVHAMSYKRWVSASGAPWPYQDEFETGCTVEHAGYALTWLVAFFGPVNNVMAFATTVIHDKRTDVPLDNPGPDFSVACLQFASGLVARLTCSIVAPADHSIRIFGDEGTMSTTDCWKPRSPVYLQRRVNIAKRSVLVPWRWPVRLLGNAALRRQSRGLKKVDFCLGPTELAAAIQEHRPCRIGADFCLHITEILLAIHETRAGGSSVKIRSSFRPIEPMPWAK